MKGAFLKIKSITVQNFGPLKCITLPCDPLTILVGKNGVGKSAILKALQLFYNTSISVDERDYYNEETENDIIINVKFTELSESEKKLLKKYVKGDELSVEKVISYNEGKIQQRYHGSRFINPLFSDFRLAGGQKMREEYKNIRKTIGTVKLQQHALEKSGKIVFEIDKLNFQYNSKIICCTDTVGLVRYKTEPSAIICPDIIRYMR